MLNLARQPDCILGSSCNPGRLYTIAILSIEGSLLPFCATPQNPSCRNSLVVVAEWTGLEPATSGVTGWGPSSRWCFIVNLNYSVSVDRSQKLASDLPI